MLRLPRVRCCVAIRVVAVVAALLVSLTCVAAAGAASVAHDFERPVAIPANRALSVSSVRTVLIAPGKSFELVGFRWRGSGVPKLSLQSENARGWSKWVALEARGIDGPDAGSSVDRGAVASSDPVWTGLSRRVRVRISGRGFRGLRAHFVAVTHSTVQRGVAVAASAGGAQPFLLGAPGARTSVDAPAIVPRSAWDPNNRCRPRVKSSLGEVLGTVVHHTESTNAYSRAEAAGVVLGICQFHRNGRGWNDIGYNLLIDRFGTVYEGRNGGVTNAVVGAHAEGYNGQTAGIALIGGFMSTAPPDVTIAALKQVLQWKLGLAGITTNDRVSLVSNGGPNNKYANGRTIFVRPVSGHRDFDFTDCPGNVLYGKLDQVSSFLTAGTRTATKITARLRRIRQGTGQAVLVSGRLRGGGKALTGKFVSIQIYTFAGYKPIAAARTDEDGIWRSVVAPKYRYYMRAAYAGDETLRSVRSPAYLSPAIRR